MEKNNMYPNMMTHQYDEHTAPPSYDASQSPAQLPQPAVSRQARTVIIQPIASNAVFGPRPQIAQCTNCGERNLTRVEYETSNKTHFAALLMCLVGLWCCCCMPYCIDSFKNTMHYCKKCGNFMGVYNK